MHILVFGSQELSRSCRDVSLIIIIFALVHGTYIDIACCFCSFNAGAYTYKSFRGADVGWQTWGPPGSLRYLGLRHPFTHQITHTTVAHTHDERKPNNNYTLHSIHASAQRTEQTDEQSESGVGWIDRFLNKLLCHNLLFHSAFDILQLRIFKLQQWLQCIDCVI